MIYMNHYDSPLGGITVSSNGREITGLWFDGQKYFGDTLSKDYEEKPLPVFDGVKEWLDIYFGGKEPDFTPPMSMVTTPFRKSVWDILLTIPYGQTMTYGEIADKIAKQNGTAKMSAQAVVGTIGSLTGFAGGFDKKKRLLALEGVDISAFFVPKKGTAL